MSLSNHFYFSFLLLIGNLFFASCNAQENGFEPVEEEAATVEFKLGAERTELYLKALTPESNKPKVGLVVNQTSQLNNTHLLDFLLMNDVEVTKVFAPEHGFRGKADAGEKVDDAIDTKTGLPIVSLYGSHKKPTAADLNDIDIVIFDIQDVGVRFYTYISTLQYVMEACAENDKKLYIFDRPNPNGHYVDGYVLEKQHQSFVGMQSIPVVHGMTIGEYAKMLNESEEFSTGESCDLTIVPMQAYNHNMTYDLPIKPSPNLPNANAIAWYPSTCFFEGTNVSVGRGTDHQFQVYGAPNVSEEFADYSFTPKPNEGAKNPKHNGKVCYGFSLVDEKAPARLDLSHLIKFYNLYPDQDEFFLDNGFFELLAGTTRLREALINGLTEEEIREEWAYEVEQFKLIRSDYLLYPDFE